MFMGNYWERNWESQNFPSNKKQTGRHQTGLGMLEGVWVFGKSQRKKNQSQEELSNEN